MAIFVSYSHSDSDMVEKIAAHLVKANIHIWIDKWELNYGDSLIQRIQEAITESSVLLVMLSKSSIKSEWCKKELTAGLVRELEEKRVVVIPVLLEDCEIPIFLRDKFYADFRSDFTTTIQNLQSSLLKMTDITLNRVKTDEFFIDWAVEDGLKNDHFWLHVDSVSFSTSIEYSILCSLEVIGNVKVTDIYLKIREKGGEHIFLDELINSLVELDANNDFRLFIEDNKPKQTFFTIRDARLGYEFEVNFYCRRMGLNNGYDILFDYGSIIRLISMQRDQILKKPPSFR